MNGAHAGGVTRAVILTARAAGPRTPPLARPTPVPEWAGDKRRGLHRRGTKTYRAFVRRVAKRRARKGYRYADGRHL